MNYFEQYTSNTVAGSGNQLWFSSHGIRTGRVFYKIAVGGTYSYSLLFSNTLDSTYSDGSVGYKNMICDEWNILRARVGTCKREVSFDGSTTGNATRIPDAVRDFVPLTFGGAESKTVAPGEFFATDPVTLTPEAGDYLCLEMTYEGTCLPYHEESLLPIFRATEEGWVYDRAMPLPSMVGCDRTVSKRIAYLGDSITQGIGTKYNSYRHWNALVSRELGEEYAFWNLGIGYGRADDLASGGAWMFKALQNDVAVVCYGVNDLNRGFTEDQIIGNLRRITDRLTAAGITVVLQTVPPFDYNEARTERWHRINHRIKTEFSGISVFDVVPVLGKTGEPHKANYGGHPNELGCARWAEALLNHLRQAGIPAKDPKPNPET